MVFGGSAKQLGYFDIYWSPAVNEDWKDKSKTMMFKIYVIFSGLSEAS